MDPVEGGVIAFDWPAMVVVDTVAPGIKEAQQRGAAVVVAVEEEDADMQSVTVTAPTPSIPLVVTHGIDLRDLMELDDLVDVVEPAFDAPPMYIDAALWEVLDELLELEAHTEQVDDEPLPITHGVALQQAFQLTALPPG